MAVFEACACCTCSSTFQCLGPGCAYGEVAFLGVLPHYLMDTSHSVGSPSIYLPVPMTEAVSLAYKQDLCDGSKDRAPLC